jgi:hypothetical protein
VVECDIPGNEDSTSWAECIASSVAGSNRDVIFPVETLEEALLCSPS